METVDLPGTDLNLSRLAFGSSGLMSRLGRRQSLRLLEIAHEAGITHFDTARSYGYGEAESAVGEFLAWHRDNLTITTKLGIVPPRRSRTMRVAKAVGRAAARPELARRVLRKSAQGMVRLGRFDPREARKSLETSLRELRVETVDILLLHECRPSDLRTEGLLEFLEQAVRAGKIRYFGTGTDIESTEYALRNSPEFARIVQIEHNLVEPTLERLPLRGSGLITHSVVRLGLPALSELMRDERRRESWSRALSVDCGDPHNLARLLMANALRSNSGGVVLFSSAREERIRADAALADSAVFSTEQLRKFARLVGETLSLPSLS
jgi:D-threo-aldose 1-dehydrogenase